MEDDLITQRKHVVEWTGIYVGDVRKDLSPHQIVSG